MLMKKTYEAPVVNVEAMEVEDVLTTSTFVAEIQDNWIIDPETL